MLFYPVFKVYFFNKTVVSFCR